MRFVTYFAFCCLIFFKKLAFADLDSEIRSIILKGFANFNYEIVDSQWVDVDNSGALKFLVAFYGDSHKNNSFHFHFCEVLTVLENFLWYFSQRMKPLGHILLLPSCKLVVFFFFFSAVSEKRCCSG